MGELYKVVFSGQLCPGVDRDKVVSRFGQQFQMPESKVRALLSTNGQVILKKNLPEETAQRYRQVLEKLGMVVTLKAMATPQVPDLSGLTLEPMEEKWEVSTCPNCKSERMLDGSCQECGIVIEKYLATYGNVPGMAFSARSAANQGLHAVVEDVAPDEVAAKRQRSDKS